MRWDAISKETQPGTNPHGPFFDFFNRLLGYGPVRMVDDPEPDELSPLLLAARQGDRGALSRLLRGLWPWLRWKASSLVSRAAPIGVSSLTQETALRFSRKLSKVRATDSPSVKALLHRIMRNTAVSAHRSAAAAKRDPARLLLAELNPERSASIEEQLEQAESLNRLYVAILRLPDRQRQASLLPLLHNYTKPGVPQHGSLAEVRLSLGVRVCVRMRR